MYKPTYKSALLNRHESITLLFSRLDAFNRSHAARIADQTTTQVTVTTLPETSSKVEAAPVVVAAAPAKMKAPRMKLGRRKVG